MTEKKRRGEKLGEALGTGLARRFARDLLARVPFRNLFREGMKRLSGARQRSAALEKAPFSAVSAAWNIRPGQEKNFIRMRRAEFFCGTGLCCFAALGFLRQALFEISPLPIRLFSSAACLSVLCAGLTLAACARWRIAVLREKRFIPFPAWLRRTLTGGKR